MAGIGSIQGLNQFQYCFNNPVNMSDPSGCWPKWSTKVAKVAVNIIKAVVIVAAIVLVTVVALDSVQPEVLAADVPLAEELAEDVCTLGQEVEPVIEAGAQLVENAVEDVGTLIDPNTIKYTQNSIGKIFGNKTEHAGESINGLIEGLKNGSITADDIPPIRIFKNAENELCSLDNRRLYCFKQAGKLIKTVYAEAKDVARETTYKIYNEWEITVRGR